MNYERIKKTIVFKPTSLPELATISGAKAMDQLEPNDVAFRIDGSALGEAMPSSPTIAALIDCHKTLSARGVSFSLCGLSKNFRSTLRVSWVDTLLTVA
jgi:hypothetical protein